MSTFLTDYQQARQAFLSAAADADADIESVLHPLLGPDGGELYVDVAWVGPRDAEAVVMLGSGTHGVEGICGSALQRAQLESSLSSRLPAGVALFFVHAINPYGFAWHRRVNEDNVDLNRNFVDFDLPLRPNPGYWDLRDAVNPTMVDDAHRDASIAAVANYQAEHGFDQMMRAFSGGQYEDPSGIQFGGKESVWSNTTIRSLWDTWLADVDLVLNIDIHSGLGPKGMGLIFQNANADDRQSELADQWWGNILRVDREDDQAKADYPGLLGPALDASRPTDTTVSIVLEFGTYEPFDVGMAMIGDNWVHHHGDLSSEAGRDVKQRIIEVFCPDDRQWEADLLTRCDEVVTQALNGAAEVLLLA